jgi:hypothetical protein
MLSLSPAKSFSERRLEILTIVLCQNILKLFKSDTKMQKLLPVLL